MNHVLLLTIRDSVPVELQVPIKSSDVDAGGILSEVILKRLVGNHINDGTDDGLWILMDPLQQRLQPAFRALFFVSMCVCVFVCVQRQCEWCASRRNQIDFQFMGERRDQNKQTC